ncbi:type II toxin-antitoxin system death-on-curing family toxin [Geminocystis sp. NIES-3709]|uniref:type II toxin-antitoxin system death-on-curing family toxin n=1 Tax=Geminocystis sp. NIES-3709 TaxID=1617448 RepID=UPI0005FC578D|nr:type II toxin-antitoxin system death-on-curing family toxin [Geminocystis sp. NIES-3709]BAQ64600.1 death on curing protein [Geminocystis sp. NIES-3709]
MINTSEPKWLNKSTIVEIHRSLISKSGGTGGILNNNALESTLNKAKNSYYYENNNFIPQLACIYAYGFIKNHCFIDGNKRIALAVMTVFLEQNGVIFNGDLEDTLKVFLKLAESLENQEKSVNELTQWLVKNINNLTK